MASAANPLLKTDGNFDIVAKFELSMIDDFIEGVVGGSLISGLSPLLLSLIDIYKGSGSIDSKLDLSGNAAYAAIFDVETVTYVTSTSVMDVIVSMKHSVTSQYVK